MMHVIIETGHQTVNDTNIGLIVIKLMMKQVQELGAQNKLPENWPIIR